MQYRLSTLLLIFFFVAATLATFQIPGIWIAFVFLITALTIHRKETLVPIAAGLSFAVVFSLPAFLWPFIQNAREAAIEANSTSPVKGIGLGLHNYHDKYKHFPPHIITNSTGQPLRSWRVEVLPFLEYDALYNQLDKNQPWDSPRNKNILHQSPNDTPFTGWGYFSEAKNPSTLYMAVIGPGTAWRSDRPVEFSELPDGGTHTVMMVEVANSGVHWAAPRDLTVEEALEGLKTGKGLRISTYLRKQLNVLMADGMIYYLPTKMPLSLWKKLLAGELSVDQLHNIRSLIDSNAPDMVDASVAPKGFDPGFWGMVSALLVWLFAVILLFHRAIKSRKKHWIDQLLASTPIV